MTATRNRLTLADLADLDTGAIAALSAEELAMLAEEARQAFDRAKGLKDRLDVAVDLKYGARAAAARRAADKDTGTVRFQDGEFTVAADLPKKVQWDQGRLTALAAEIQAGGEDPGEYLTTELKVSERAYGAWPSSIRSAFAPARTVSTGKPAYQLIRNERS